MRGKPFDGSNTCRYITDARSVRFRMVELYQLRKINVFRASRYIDSKLCYQIRQALYCSCLYLTIYVGEVVKNNYWMVENCGEEGGNRIGGEISS